MLENFEVRDLADGKVVVACSTTLYFEDPLSGMDEFTHLPDSNAKGTMQYACVLTPQSRMLEKANGGRH
jgi:hypothetical protein